MSSGGSGSKQNISSYFDFQLLDHQGFLPAPSLERDVKALEPVYRQEESGLIEPTIQATVGRPGPTLVLNSSELELIVQVFRYHFDRLSYEGERLSLIHHQHMLPDQRSSILSKLSGIAHLYVSSTPESRPEVFDLIYCEVQHLYLQVRLGSTTSMPFHFS